jgi:futalosine hydrolase
VQIYKNNSYMQHLITAATKMELAAVQSHLQNADDVTFALTGVGMMATTCTLSDLLAQGCYDLVINVGLAGTFTPQLDLGQVVMVEREFIDGYGVEDAEGGIKISPNSEMACPYATDFPALQAYPKVSGLTVSLLTENPARVALRKNLYDADVETMEGAAFFYVCLRKQVRFLQLRAISNVVGVRDKSQWKTAEALKNLAESVWKFNDSKIQ